MDFSPILNTLSMLKEMWLKPKEKQLVLRQLKLTANEPVTKHALLITEPIDG